MDLNLSQPQFDFCTTNAKSTAMVAGFGSGKTEAALIDMSTTMFQHPGADMLYLAPTFPLIRDIWYPKVESFFDSMNLGYKINRGEHTIHIDGAGCIFCRTMEHPHRIIGFEVLDAYLDELDVLPEEKAMEVWRKTKARCRQKVKGKLNQMKVTTTPEGYKATYELFKNNPLPNSQLIHCSTYSNLHNLPDDYIDELMANYPKQLIKAYIMGYFVNLVNMPVWGEYDVDVNTSKVVATDTEPLTVGMDFNVGRGCAVAYAHRDILVDDTRHPRHQEYLDQIAVWTAIRVPPTKIQVLTKNMVLRDIPIWETMHSVSEVVDSYDTPDTIRALNEYHPLNPITVIPDASGDSRKSVNATTSDIALLKQAGYTVTQNKRNPNIKDRVMATNRMFCNGLEHRSLFVNKAKTPHFSDGLIKQVYDKNGLPEKGAGKKDDITDAGSYPPAYLHPIKKVVTTVREI